MTPLRTTTRRSPRRTRRRPRPIVVDGQRRFGMMATPMFVAVCVMALCLRIDALGLIERWVFGMLALTAGLALTGLASRRNRRERDVRVVPKALARTTLSDERVVRVVYKHWTENFWWILAMYVLFAAATWVLGDVNDANSVKLVFSIWLVCAAYLLYRIASTHVAVLMITELRIVQRTGLFTKKVGMMPITKVTDFQMHVPPMGRILGKFGQGYGTLDFESAGQDQGIKLFTHTPNIYDVWREISAEVLGRSGGGDS